MELFMDLDKNNDNFVDRKDLIKYYGMLQRIKGASVVPQYKCKQGHKMKQIVHDQNFKLKEKVRLGFKLTTENKQNGWYKFNKQIGEIFG